MVPSSASPYTLCFLFNGIHRKCWTSKNMFNNTTPHLILYFQLVWIYTLLRVCLSVCIFACNIGSCAEITYVWTLHSKCCGPHQQRWEQKEKCLTYTSMLCVCVCRDGKVKTKNKVFKQQNRPKRHGKRSKDRKINKTNTNHKISY